MSIRLLKLIVKGIYPHLRCSQRTPRARNKAILSSSFVLGPSVQIWKNHPYIGQIVSPGAHAVCGFAVINCGIEIYGLTPRDYVSPGYKIHGPQGALGVTINNI